MKTSSKSNLKNVLIGFGIIVLVLGIGLGVYHNLSEKVEIVDDCEYPPGKILAVGYCKLYKTLEPEGLEK